MRTLERVETRVASFFHYRTILLSRNFSHIRLIMLLLELVESLEFLRQDVVGDNSRERDGIELEA